MLYFGYFLLVILGFINLNVVLKVIKGNILAFNPVSLFSLVVLSQFSYVLIEAMQYGVVPFAFDSYKAASDIIKDGVDGFLISPFDVEKYSEKLG